MTSTKRLYLAPDAPYPYQNDHYLVMDKVGSESAVKILASDLFSDATGSYAGGNIAHLTNGPAAAGQKTVTLDETTGFLPNGWVAYTRVDGAIEYNLIAAVTDATHLLLTSNIGATGIGDNIYVGMVPVDVYQAANSFYHGATAITLPDATGRLNRGDYYVKLTPGASAAVNTAAIVHAVAASTAGDYGAVVLPPGTFKVTGDVITLARVEETNRACPIFKGAGRGVTILDLDTGDEGAILTITGSWQIRDMSFGGSVITGGIGHGGTGAFVRRMTEGGGFFDCNFRDFDYGILTDEYQAFAEGAAMQGTHTVRCQFEACAEAGVYLESVMNANHFLQCVFMNGFPSDPGTHLGCGIRIGSTESNILIHDCQFLSHRNAILIHGNSAGVSITNNYFETVFAETGPYIIVDGMQSDIATTSLANGAASAGQKDVVVDSYLNFDTDWVYYTLVGGVVERNKIATVTALTNTLTMANNIGIGGIANNTPVTQISTTTNLSIQNNVISFYWEGGDPAGCFLQLRDARAVTLINNWSGSYGKGLVDLTDDYGVAVTTVRGLVLINNRNEYAYTKMFVNDDMGLGCVAFRQDITDKDSGHLPFMWMAKDIYSLPDRAGDHNFGFYTGNVLSLYLTSAYADAQQGLRIGTGTKISKYMTNVEATLDFGSIPAHSTAELNFAFTGAAINDQVIIAPIWIIEAGLMWGAYVNVANYVTVRLANVTAADINPASGIWAISVIKHG